VSRIFSHKTRNERLRGKWQKNYVKKLLLVAVLSVLITGQEGNKNGPLPLNKLFLCILTRVYFQWQVNWGFREKNPINNGHGLFVSGLIMSSVVCLRSFILFQQEE
jgi:hypothetical protein